MIMVMEPKSVQLHVLFLSQLLWKLRPHQALLLPGLMIVIVIVIVMVMMVVSMIAVVTTSVGLNRAQIRENPETQKQKKQSHNLSIGNVHFGQSPSVGIKGLFGNRENELGIY